MIEPKNMEGQNKYIICETEDNNELCEFNKKSITKLLLFNAINKFFNFYNEL